MYFKIYRKSVSMQYFRLRTNSFTYIFCKFYVHSSQSARVRKRRYYKNTKQKCTSGNIYDVTRSTPPVAVNGWKRLFRCESCGVWQLLCMLITGYTPPLPCIFRWFNWALDSALYIWSQVFLLLYLYIYKTSDLRRVICIPKKTWSSGSFSYPCIGITSAF